MTDFLLELLSEEIPARMQAKARADLARLFADEIGRAGLAAAAIETYATPRRLALIARGLPEATEAQCEETKGPKASAPPQAVEGFLRKTGLRREQLEERGGVLFAVVERPGRATTEVLAAAIPAIVRAFPWPKSMRWGAASRSTSALRWVRPLKGIVALFGDALVPCAVEGVESGFATVGHRFHHPGPVTIGGAHDYAAKLRACHVIVDPDERAAIIAEQASLAATGAGLELVRDEALIAENAGLTEWPVPLLGRFDPAFLGVPPEVIQLTMATNQKYFACRDADGALAPAFVLTANIEAADGGAAIVAGNQRVLAARLSDAKFFWEQDLKVRLDDQAEKLSGIVFHEKLGTVADKVERVAKLARWLVEEGIVRGTATTEPSRTPAQAGVQLPTGGGSNPAPATTSPFVSSEVETRAESGGGEARPSTSARGAEARPERLPWQAAEGLGTNGDNKSLADLADLAERAVRLAKADLVTGMVGEFPELQGVMGGYYACAQGEDPRVADAIRDHYKPVGQGDEVPTAPVTVAVSLADKLDTIGAFYTAEMPPSGSRDPFALRRACLGSIHTIVENSLRIKLLDALSFVTSIVWIQRENAEAERDKPRSDLIGKALKVVEAERQALTDRQRLELVIAEHPNIEILDSSAPSKVLDFFADRLKVQQREAGVRHDLIDAVFALGGEDDLVRLLARVKALQAFVGTEDGANLLAGYKRAANILKKEGFAPGDGSDPAADGAPDPAEDALADALAAAEPRAAAAVEGERFEEAMAALATLRAPIDRFFDAVTVNDADQGKRARRLALLDRVRAAVHRVADFSKIEG